MNKDVITFNSEQGPIALASRQAHLIPAGIEVHPEVRVIDSEMKERLATVLESLTYRERELIKMNFGIGYEQPKSLEECAQIFKIRIERARQVIAKAIRRLQHPVRARKLLEYLPGQRPDTRGHWLVPEAPKQKRVGYSKVQRKKAIRRKSPQTKE